MTPAHLLVDYPGERPYMGTCRTCGEAYRGLKWHVQRHRCNRCSLVVPAAPVAASPPRLQLPERPCDWVEDYSHENGGYQCECIRCKGMFYGHKRRHVCKVCAATPASARIIIANLLESMDNVKDRTDEELLAAFLDTETEPVIRDTAQVILEARSFLGKQPDAAPGEGVTKSGDCSPKRSALHASRGKPVLSLEFEVFASSEVSMWTHFNHGTPFQEAEAGLHAIQAHLAKFIRDKAMCPFHRSTQAPDSPPAPATPPDIAAPDNLPPSTDLLRMDFILSGPAVSQGPPDLTASSGHEEAFRTTFRLRDDLADDPEAIRAFEYAATHKLKPMEMAYIGAAVVRIESPTPSCPGSIPPPSSGSS